MAAPLDPARAVAEQAAAIPDDGQWPVWEVFTQSAEGAPQEQRRLTEEIERDVGERDVLLENGRVSAPLAQPVTEHEPVVAEAQQQLELVVRWFRRRRYD